MSRDGMDISYFQNHKGQGSTEYAIILLLVAVLSVVVYNLFSVDSHLGTMYSSVSSDLKLIAKDKDNDEESENPDDSGGGIMVLRPPNR